MKTRIYRVRTIKSVLSKDHISSKHLGQFKDEARVVVEHENVAFVSAVEQNRCSRLAAPVLIHVQPTLAPFLWLCGKIEVVRLLIKPFNLVRRQRLGLCHAQQKNRRKGTQSKHLEHVEIWLTKAITGRQALFQLERGGLAREVIGNEFKFNHK